MGATLPAAKAGLGTAPVFMTAISTILGAVMFLRFGYAVGNVGFWGVMGVIALGHLVTISTAMAIAEIATNQRVEGGGEYYIISRSFGLTPGGAIGIALFLSQAISVAFYVIAFAEAFDPLFDLAREHLGLDLVDKRIVSLPTIVGITTLILIKGMSFGMKALYVVVTILLASLVFFFVGDTDVVRPDDALLATVREPAPFFLVFAICFPAFTGMTAGVGLSGDLRNPKRSIPIGTLSATLTGIVVYVLLAYKLAISATPDELVADQLIMSRISIWGPIIPIGLACATISSALGSFLVAPRTLQAIGADGLLPSKRLGRWLARGRKKTNDPTNASLVTAALAVGFVVAGDVDFVAQIISMFFMVTYGSLCLISFLQHFAADPSYRPTFRSRWFISALGACLCVWLMFKMSAAYAAFAIVVMVALYVLLSWNNQGKEGLSSIFQGVIFQSSRQLQVFLQKSRKQESDSWRPSIVCISQASFRRLAAFDFLRWAAHRYGFGSYIHYIPGYLSRETHEDSRRSLERLIQLSDVAHSNVYVDTIVSPSYAAAVAQLLQLPGISGKENNLLLFEYWKTDTGGLDDIVENYPLVVAAGFDVCILASCDRGFGYRRQIHLWLTPRDYENSNLMILLAYILLGHPEWKGAVIKIFSLLPEEGIDEARARLNELIGTGRLPISSKNVENIAQQPDVPRKTVITEHSRDADLTILGFRGEALKKEETRSSVFSGYEGIGAILFVNTVKEIDLLGTGNEVIDADTAADTAAETDGEEPHDDKGDSERADSDDRGQPAPAEDSET